MEDDHTELIGQQARKEQKGVPGSEHKKRNAATSFHQSDSNRTFPPPTHQTV